MDNPVLVEVLRGNRVESRHRGAVAVVDGDGAVVLAVGDIDQPVYPRSTVKVIQALPLVESGAADAFGFGDRELALACASHRGEPLHVATAADMLARAGLEKDALECGPHWPNDHASTVRLAREGGEPSALHNNCSGKHAGFLCTCRHRGIEHRGYVAPDHPVQAAVRQAMEEVTGAAHSADNRAVDGCSIPTYAVPIRNLALGFARMASGKGLSRDRNQAVRRLFTACMAEPFMVSGTGRPDTEIMRAGKGRIFVKTGAEGVHCAALPEYGYGIAIKCDDGAGRASDSIVAAVLARHLADDPDISATLMGICMPAVSSRNGVTVGRIRPTPAVTG
ncbi:MAG: asparaginase [Rhizobiaceae bacterium]|nr:asparaginase [Rhizobiaceae bacterium]